MSQVSHLNFYHFSLCENVYSLSQMLIQYSLYYFWGLQLKSDFLQLLKEQSYLERHSRWSESKKKIDSDPRYKAVDSSSRREDWFRDYVKTLDDKKETKEVLDCLIFRFLCLAVRLTQDRKFLTPQSFKFQFLRQLANISISGHDQILMIVISEGSFCAISALHHFAVILVGL